MDGFNEKSTEQVQEQQPLGCLQTIYDSQTDKSVSQPSYIGIGKFRNIDQSQSIE